MPQIVKASFQKLKKVFDTDFTEAVLITEENYTDYIDIPDYVIEKY